MKNNILIKIKNDNKILVIKKLIKYKVEYNYIKNEGDYVYVKLDKRNYAKVKNIFLKNDLIFIKEYGKKGLINYIKNNIAIIICIIISIILLYYLTNLTFEIEIISDNNELVNDLTKELYNNGIKKYAIKKNYNELLKIKKQILKNNDKRLQWLEIKYEGTKLILELTQRNVNEDKDNTNIYNIVAKKDALITKIIVKNGVLLKEINDYVKKGDIIISSSVVNNSNEIVNKVSAEGSVYGEVWYNVTTTVPYEYVEYFTTNNSFNNVYILLNGNKFNLIGVYNIKNVLIEKKILIDKPYLNFKLINEKKEIFDYKVVKVTANEAKNEAIKRSIKAIENKLSNDEYIIDKKVLKINNFSSKVSVEVFFRVYENIREKVYAE